MRYLTSLFCIAIIAGCTQMSPSLEPVPGSITYGGQTRSKLAKAPIGSIVTNRLRDQYGQPFEEIYIIQPDRSLKLVRRHSIDYPDR